MRPLAYIVGRSFLPAMSGLSMRTRLTFDYFTRTSQVGARHLLAPCGQPELEPAVAPHWQRDEIGTGPAGRGQAQKPTKVEALRQMRDMMACRWSASARTRILGYFSGLDFGASSAIQARLASWPDAVVFLTRSDLLPLVRHKAPGQKWILDANDSVANLVRAYDGRRRLRKSVGMDNAKLCRILEEAELRAAGRCDAIIAISPADEQYFKRSACPVISMEEQCVEYTAGPVQPKAPKYDIGFIGSDHEGSRKAALSLVEVAQNPRTSRFSFAIAGRVTQRLHGISPSPNLSLVGEVPSSQAFLADCRATVFISSGETGTSVKFQEAILSGTTVIANANAARWSLAKPGRDYLEIADSDALVPLLEKGLPCLPLAPALSAHATREALQDRLDAVIARCCSQ